LVAVLVTVTPAFATMAPAESLTVPVMVAVSNWAQSGIVAQASAIANKQRRFICIHSLGAQTPERAPSLGDDRVAKELPENWPIHHDPRGVHPVEYRRGSQVQTTPCLLRCIMSITTSRQTQIGSVAALGFRILLHL